MGIVILFLRQNKLVKIEENQKKTTKEMEELMSSYLFEMKDENERFIKRVKEMNEEQLATFKQKEKESLPQKKPAHLVPKNDDQPDLSSRLENTVSLQAARAYQKQKLNLSEKEVVLETDRHQGEAVELDDRKVLQTKENTPESTHNELLKESLLFQILIMKQQGFTVEEMAKRLNKGKTEIALLLKFHEKHQE